MAHENTYKRKEIKYLLDEEQATAFLKDVMPYLREDFFANSTVLNLYCDSPDWQLARRSLEKPEYKEKLRLRGYGALSPTSTVFLELKKKYKGVVYKRRFACTLSQAMAYLNHGVFPDGADQVLREIDYALHYYGLRPALCLAYDRQAFCGKEDAEFRVTFDANVRSRFHRLDLLQGGFGAPLHETPYTIMEIKADAAMPQWMLSLLARHKLVPTSFSKYGAVYTQSGCPLGQALAQKEDVSCFKAS